MGSSFIICFGVWVSCLMFRCGLPIARSFKEVKSGQVSRCMLTYWGLFGVIQIFDQLLGLTRSYPIPTCLLDP